MIDLKYRSEAKHIFSSAGGRVWVDFERVAQMLATIDSQGEEIEALGKTVADLKEMTWRLRFEMDNVKDVKKYVASTSEMS